jgi:DNA-binding transcriptional regulator YdaS (Cro superfamily)
MDIHAVWVIHAGRRANLPAERHAAHARATDGHVMLQDARLPVLHAISPPALPRVKHATRVTHA